MGGKRDLSHKGDSAEGSGGVEPLDKSANAGTKASPMPLFQAELSLATAPIAASAPISLKTQGPQGLEEITVPVWKEEEVATCPSPTPERDLLARGSGGAVGCGEPRADCRTAEQSKLPTHRRRWWRSPDLPE